MKQSIYNRTAPAITPDMVAEAQKAIISISGIFPFLAGLSAEERRHLAAISVDNKVFTDDAFEAAMNHPEVLPAYLSAESLKNDLEGFKALDKLLEQVSELYDKLRDTRLLMGATAYSAARSVYQFLGRGVKDGVPGAEAAYLQLKERFKGQGNFRKDKGKEDTPTET